MIPFKKMLLDADWLPPGWVFLPRHKQWDLETPSIVLQFEEVPPEEENKPNAGIPDFALKNNLLLTLDVPSLQDIMINLREQEPKPSPELMLKAFLYYFEHDAFIDLDLPDANNSGTARKDESA